MNRSHVLAAGLALALVPFVVHRSLLADDKPGANPPAAAAPASVSPELKAKTEQAMARGYKWLVSQQHENGSWGEIPGVEVKGEAGITGLALRALAKAPPALRKENEAAIQKAAAYIVSMQRADGSITNEGAGLTTYRTSIGVMALLATDPAKYADNVKRAVKYIEGSQFSEEHGLDPADAKSNPNYGGWGYDKTETKPQANLSTTHFNLEALKEAGVPADDPAFKRAQLFLQRCQSDTETNDLAKPGSAIGNDGGMMYDAGIDTSKSEPVKNPDGTTTIPSYGSMTYAGLMSFLYANVSKDDPRVKAAYAWITRHYTLQENPGLSTRRPDSGKQGLYYYFQTFSKALNTWGDGTVKAADGTTRIWAADLAQELISLQKPEGFWVNDVKRWWEGEPTLTTSYSLIALDTAYPWLEKAAAPPAGSTEKK